MRGSVIRYVFLLVLVGLQGIANAAGVNGPERYYEPLDKLASNPTLLSRNKEVPNSNDDIFPFSSNEYAGRMNRISGCTWDALTSLHLNKLTGTYADRVFDAMGIYAELQAKISDEFRKKQVSENYQMLAPMLSGMNVHYVSSGSKRGIWQLDIVTATRYGLVVSDIRDDRDDPILSARVAAAYIKDLQTQFRSPEAILWAYIGSPAEVRRAFVRAESTDPKKVVDFLPEYLKPAIPVFSAWTFIWTYADKDNVSVFTPAMFQPYENVLTDGKTHLGQISEVLDIPLSSLKELNPTLKKQIAENRETVRLPQGYASRFLAQASKISGYKDTLYFRPDVITRPTPPTYATAGTAYVPSTLNSTVKKYHKVKPGETLSQLAQKYHVSVTNLRKWNHLSSSGIIAGQKIVVNVSVQNQIAEKEDRTVRENIQIEGTISDENTTEPATNTAEPTKAKLEVVKTTTPKPPSAWIYYTVRSGDTLSSIGRKYGVSYEKIKEWNGLRSDKLSVGQKLKIKK